MPYAAGPTGKVVLTRDSGNENGAAWNPCTIDITQNFTLSFDFNWGNQTCGADGMAFVLQADGAGSTRNPGFDPGNQGYIGISNSIGVIFDSYSNVPLGDPVFDSLDLKVGGASASVYPTACGGPGPTLAGSTCARPQILASSTNVKDGLDHVVTIDWVASTATLTVTVDGSLRATYIFPANYVTSIFGGNNNVYYGVTAHTGGSDNYHQFGQISAQRNGSPLSVICGVPTATVIASLTPFPLIANTCGTPTNIPTFSHSPTATPYQSPTLTPTPFPVGCGIPTLRHSSTTFSNANVNATNTFNYNNTAVVNNVLIVRMETNNNNLPTSVTYGGIALTLLGASVPLYTGNGYLRTYYLLNAPTGINTLSMPFAGPGASWNVMIETYEGVDQVTPFGNIATASGTTTSQNLTTTVTTVNSASVISNYLAIAQGPAITPGSGQTVLNYPTNCCENVYANMKDAPGAGSHFLYYRLNTGPDKQYTSQIIEIRGPASCGTPSFTATGTSTRTNTPNPSATFTQTATRSSTVTPSATFTASPSGTHTGTRTASPTNSATATVTDTVTTGPSPTFSHTATASATQTSTRTNSPSPTGTTSFSSTATPSGTPTVTPSATETASRTASPSNTSTSTASPVYSPTNTPTSTATPSITPSSTGTASYSNTPSVTFTPTITATATQTLTVSSTNTPSDTRTVTPTGSATPSFSETPTRTLTWTASATPQPVPHQVKILVYNSAGELVKTLFQGQAQYQLGELKIDRDLLLVGSSASILFPGFLKSPQTGALLGSLPWAATNDNGQTVANGVYLIKVEIVDNFGLTTTLQRSLQVLSITPENSLNIYNSAGELVVSLGLPTGGSGRYNGMRLSTESLALKADEVSGAMIGAPLTVWLMDERGVEYSITWSGRNAQGAPLSSGSYTAELVYASGSGGRSVASSKGFVVIQAGPLASLAGAVAYPNPVLKGGDILVRYVPTGGSEAVGRLYNLNGELVGQADDKGLSGTLRFKGGSLAAGVYVVKVEKLTGTAVLAKVALKVAVVR